MARVIRSNITLDIADEDISFYQAKGFNLVDDNGNVDKSAIPTTIGELQAQYVMLTNRVKELEAENEYLHQQLKSAKAKKSVKTE